MPSLHTLDFVPGARILSSTLVLLALGCGSDATGLGGNDPASTLGEGPFEGLFVAAGDDRLVFSTDGAEWIDVDSFGASAVPVAGRRIVDIAATRRQLVVTEINEGEISRFRGEPDRFDVQSLSSPVYSLTTDQSSFLGFGLHGVYGSSNGLEFVSLDTNIGFPTEGLEVAPNLAFGQGRYIAVLTFRDPTLEFRMGIATSVDGVVWEATDVWARLGFHVDLIRDGMGFVALGTRGPPENARRVVWTSSDGLAWVEQWLESHGGASPRTLARAPDGRIVVLGGGSTGGIYRWYSDDDGSTWTKDVVLPGPEDAPLDMLYAEGRFLAVLESGRIAASADGLVWTADYPAGLQGGALRSIHYVE